MTNYLTVPAAAPDSPTIARSRLASGVFSLSLSCHLLFLSVNTSLWPFKKKKKKNLNNLRKQFFFFFKCAQSDLIVQLIIYVCNYSTVASQAVIFQHTAKNEVHYIVKII